MPGTSTLKSIAMKRLSIILGLVFAFCVGSVYADELLYRYEGDVLPNDPSAGWAIFDVCEGSCSTSVQDGHFVLTWAGEFGNAVNYALPISNDDGEPPPRPSGWSGIIARIRS